MVGFLLIRCVASSQSRMPSVLMETGSQHPAPISRAKSYSDPALCGQGQLLAFPYLCNVQVEEVTVEDGLYTSSDNSDQVEESFKVVAVDPVDDVECPVGA